MCHGVMMESGVYMFKELHRNHGLVGVQCFSVRNDVH
jgi:hypothetical protein